MYAILGATGKVGGAAVRDLRHRGLSVRAIVRDASKSAHLAQIGCETCMWRFLLTMTLDRGKHAALRGESRTPMDAFTYGLKPVPFRIFLLGRSFSGILSSGLVQREIV
jgi:uncharacterized protein YbjT (DUF2867 family)